MCSLMETSLENASKLHEKGKKNLAVMNWTWGDQYFNRIEEQKTGQQIWHMKCNWNEPLGLEVFNSN